MESGGTACTASKSARTIRRVAMDAATPLLEYSPSTAVAVTFAGGGPNAATAVATAAPVLSNSRLSTGGVVPVPRQPPAHAYGRAVRAAAGDPAAQRALEVRAAASARARKRKKDEEAAAAAKRQRGRPSKGEKKRSAAESLPAAEPPRRSSRHADAAAAGMPDGAAFDGAGMPHGAAPAPGSTPERTRRERATRVVATLEKLAQGDDNRLARLLADVVDHAALAPAKAAAGVKGKGETTAEALVCDNLAAAIQATRTHGGNACPELVSAHKAILVAAAGPNLKDHRMVATVCSRLNINPKEVGVAINVRVRLDNEKTGDKWAYTHARRKHGGSKR